MSHRQLFNGLFIDFDRTSVFRHSFGGQHSTAGACCPNCSKSLMLYLTFDLHDPLLASPLVETNLRKVGLFYCMRCALCWHDFSYRQIADDEITIVRVHQGEVWSDWQEYGANVDIFPQRVIGLTAIPPRLQEIWDHLETLRYGQDFPADELAELSELTKGRSSPTGPWNPHLYFVNQVGGRALLCQGVSDPLCPTCNDGSQMYFLACLYNDTNNELRIAFECVQIVFFLCPQCFTITVLHRI